MLHFIADNWIALLAMFASLAGPFAQVHYQRYLERRDARLQSESGATRSVGRFRRYIPLAYFAIPAAALIYEVTSTAPVNRFSVFSIAMQVASLMVMALVLYIGRVNVQLLQLQLRAAALQDAHLGVTHELMGMTGQLAGATKPCSPADT